MIRGPELRSPRLISWLRQSFDSSPLRLLPRDPEERLGSEDRHTAVAADRQQVMVAADDVLSRGGNRAGDDLVVVRIPRHSSRRRRRIVDDRGECQEVDAILPNLLG